MFDTEEKRYIDYHSAFGATILGHGHPEVNQRVIEMLATTDLIGIGPNEHEVQLAEKVCQHVPCAKRVVFCNSGLEATYLALRLARVVTGRQKIIKFQGCYHSWYDAILLNFLSALAKIGQKDPLSAGMVPLALEHTLVLPFNGLAAVLRTLE